ncbi:hypothetical protein FA95DRAFT_1603999 [Auriscalpium vulgare]|uniref:Uncharacterized protein n=1 Tax=Auriscalpium vulgare TaxID=40419 RepID=A0ACB8S023_9AGAM|nr:hypothetical protein FA95DRAFT_1603999 [Auriscalpium vulgare]
MQHSHRIYGLLELYLFGIYTCLFGFALHVLIQRLKGSTTNKWLTIAITVMYLVATAHAVGSAWPFNSTSDDLERSMAIDSLLTSIATLNFVLGDGIVVWRAYVIWDRNRHILCVPFLLLLITLGTSVWQIMYTIFRVRVQANVDHAYQIGLFMTLLTNVVATGIIGYRAWQHYRSSSVVQIRIGRDRALTVLLLLVESGALYCAVWGMYPTVVIVLCKLQASYSNTIMDMRDDGLPLPVLAPDASVASSSSSNNRDPVRVQFATLPGDVGPGFLARNSSDTSLGSVLVSPAADIRADKQRIV